ncbi:hypothetical protein EDD18DRAFT_757352 [Armillaria luteobubalina]|uniref:Uncharacterized protein n=1 Tax=Armillaria luteobubalina TaxID=153913 RepID=A0AA39PG54_9AGAR|nr:hypothetical protein EDD18DRAFT_757352 [Armillaria luteobubalina]
MHAIQRTFLVILSLLLAAGTMCAGEPDQVPLQGGDLGDVEMMATPVVDELNAPTKASDQILVTDVPVPSFYPRFTECNCFGKIYRKVGDVTVVIMNGAMATPIPTSYMNSPNAPRTPHLFGDFANQFERLWKDPACSRTGNNGRTNLVEYAINNEQGTEGYKFDRVVYTTWNVGKDQPRFCGCMTHKGQVDNQFTLCTMTP